MHSRTRSRTLEWAADHAPGDAVDAAPAPISIARLEKSFGRSHATRRARPGGRPGPGARLSGSQRSGKTTTIRILLGLIGADGGSVRLLGGDPWTDRVRLHRRLAYVPGEVDLWPPSPGRGHRPAGSAAGRARRPPPRRAPRTLRARPTKKVRSYSKGTGRRSRSSPPSPPRPSCCCSTSRPRDSTRSWPMPSATASRTSGAPAARCCCRATPSPRSKPCATT